MELTLTSDECKLLVMTLRLEANTIEETARFASTAQGAAFLAGRAHVGTPEKSLERVRDIRALAERIERSL